MIKKFLVAILFFLPVLANSQSSQRAINIYYKGVENCKQGNYQAGIENFNKALKIDFTIYQANFDRGLAKANLKNYVGAIDDYSTVINYGRTFKGWSEVYYFRGVALFNLKKYKEAILDLDEYVTYENIDKEGSAHYYLGNAYYNLGKYQSALKEYTQALEYNYDVERVRFSLGCARVKLENYLEAIREFSAAIKINPNNAEYYDWRGNVKHFQKEYKEAIYDYDKAIKINPNISRYYYNRGLAKINAGFITKYFTGLTGGCSDMEIAKEMGIKEADDMIKIYCKENE